jgi:RNA polymerase sigma-70 factor, ECF subfamily
MIARHRVSARHEPLDPAPPPGRPLSYDRWIGLVRWRRAALVRRRARTPCRATAGGDRPGEATESQQPGISGTGKPLPSPRMASGSGPEPADRSHPDVRAERSDAELLRQHVDGDPDAFGELFARHRDRLWAVAVRTLRDPEDAADALQDAMISAFRRAGSFRGESAVTTWLHRIVVNACLDRMRRRAARPEVAEGDERLLDTMGTATAADPSEDSELSLEVMAALRQLPHDQQVALILVDMLEYPVAEAAQMMGVAEGTVKSRCARGRARLLPRLSHLRQKAGAASGTVPGQAGKSTDGHSFGNSTGESGGQARNRWASGSVLPGREGGDEEA